ncbi:MAG: hypothetical protein US52_C0001G0006 [candidate division WS6 bacterium GW2011_GWA2_37_6]|uniref:Lysine biosynthesis protein LysW n=1 Tax=candidate division WS6 bacterium GW2011_GWA2_37_6 TaxID=1619087 RepID=A0A0G0GZE3_9BACT|nr:MAG: hypothetical protein US52_C0001G0006 [candidate division WS6 bacterium GW2011_GWA2_37_6]
MDENTNNNDRVKSQGNKFSCLECQNDNDLDSVNDGDVVECGFCGLEYEVAEKDADGNYVLQILEEEK